MKYFDAAVIGGGILGCFAARNLGRWKLSTVLIEQAEDVCTGITRANSAIVYPGYDNKTGSQKAAMTVRGNAEFGDLCRQLDVPFSRCGSLLVTYDAQGAARLEKKLRQGIANGVPGLKLLSGPEAEAMEPMLRSGVVSALYAPTTGTVNPWQLGIAAFENALHNGTEAMRGTAVTAIRQTAEGYVLETDREPIACKVVLNCAGLQAHRVQALAFAPKVQIRCDSAEYLVLDEHAPKPSRVIFHQASTCGKGITSIPCTEGNLLLSGVRRPLSTPFATTPEGLEELRRDARSLLPELDLRRVIRSFGAVRPNPYRDDGESIPDFTIETPAPGFYSLIGIKTPGLTCANQLGLHLAEETAAYLKAEENPCFDPHRKAICRDDGPVLCRCGRITEGAVREAIARGAVTADGVKRRLGTGMGLCQGSRCTFAIEKLLQEAGHGTL